MRIKLASVMVDDQEKALAFYTGVLRFLKKTDVPMGAARWLTVVSPEGPPDVELLLEPMMFAPAASYQRALHEAGIPATSFAADDIASEFSRMTARGVAFKTPPTKAGPVTVAVFDDTCGNWIQIYQA